jgi:hypothetical protein
MRILTLFTVLSVSLFAQTTSAQTPDAGRRVFESQCARCHGPQGGGGELGPAITGTLAARDRLPLAGAVSTTCADREATAEVENARAGAEGMIRRN